MGAELAPKISKAALFKGLFIILSTATNSTSNGSLLSVLSIWEVAFSEGSEIGIKLTYTCVSTETLSVIHIDVIHMTEYPIKYMGYIFMIFWKLIQVSQEKPKKGVIYMTF